MNIAHRLEHMAQVHPDKPAMKVAKCMIEKKNEYDYPSITFKELNLYADRIAYKLREFGYKEGDKALIFIRPSINFIAINFAFFKLGIIPVMMDPGMGKENLLKCIEDVVPDHMIAEKEVHRARILYKKAFSSCKSFITMSDKVNTFMYSNTIPFKQLITKEDFIFHTSPKTNDDLACILFTSGGTGKPKGVEYTHGILNAQTDALKDLFHLTSNDTDVAGFPLFALFTIALGMTSIVPDLDVSKPKDANPLKLYQNITDNNASFVAGSPAIWEKLADFCIEKNLKLPSVKYLVMFGAPVAHRIHLKFKELLPNGTTYTPYGATEGLPVSCITGTEVINNAIPKTLNGHGVCIGKVLPHLKVKIIKITDDEISKLADIEICGTDQIGEIIVKGSTVTRHYHNNESADKLSKIEETRDGHQYLWHRMGDMGKIDKDGNLWFCGRKAHRLETSEGLIGPVQVEAIFNQHPDVFRSALVGVGPKGQQIPTIFIERKDRKKLMGKKREQFNRELLDLAAKHKISKNVVKIVHHKGFPVDVRHNIKIDRTKLLKEISKN